MLVKIYLWGKQFFAEIGDKTNENNGNESDKENEEEKEETEEEITLAKALEMVDKLKSYCLRKGLADAHSKVSEIEDKIMNFSTQNLKQSSLLFNNIIFWQTCIFLTVFYKPPSCALYVYDWK